MASVDVGLDFGTIAVMNNRDRTKSSTFKIDLVTKIPCESIFRKVLIEVEIEVYLVSKLTQIRSVSFKSNAVPIFFSVLVESKCARIHDEVVDVFTETQHQVAMMNTQFAIGYQGTKRPARMQLLVSEDRLGSQVRVKDFHG
jgi:hypothetical protein